MHYVTWLAVLGACPSCTLILHLLPRPQDSKLQCAHFLVMALQLIFRHCHLHRKVHHFLRFAAFRHLFLLSQGTTLVLSGFVVTRLLNRRVSTLYTTLIQANICI